MRWKKNKQHYIKSCNYPQKMRNSIYTYIHMCIYIYIYRVPACSTRGKHKCLAVPLSSGLPHPAWISPSDSLKFARRPWARSAAISSPRAIPFLKQQLDSLWIVDTCVILCPLKTAMSKAMRSKLNKGRKHALKNTWIHHEHMNNLNK